MYKKNYCLARQSKIRDYQHQNQWLQTLNKFLGLKNSRLSAPVPAHLLVDAGFVHSGFKDRTFCFHCGGSLQRWEKHDIPAKAHKEHFPNCEFILKTGHKFSLTKFNNQIRTSITHSLLVIPESHKSKLFQMSYAIPRLYGQLKIHKDSEPIRPVVASYTCQSNKLAKFLKCEFVQLTGFSPPHCIQDSAELAQNICDMRFPPHCNMILIESSVVQVSVYACSFCTSLKSV